MAHQGGDLKSTSINGVKMYSVSSQHRSLATWLPPKKLRALRKDKSMIAAAPLRFLFAVFCLPTIRLFYFACRHELDALYIYIYNFWVSVTADGL